MALERGDSALAVEHFRRAITRGLDSSITSEMRERYPALDLGGQ
jgi:hypothetical protein